MTYVNEMTLKILIEVSNLILIIPKIIKNLLINWLIKKKYQ